jgi:hypothetical protein
MQSALGSKIVDWDLANSLRRFKTDFGAVSIFCSSGRCFVSQWQMVCHSCGLSASGAPEVLYRHPCPDGSRVMRCGDFKMAFKATVFTHQGCKGFVGYGDADPSNVSPLVHGAEMRVAETREVNRALRKAYGIGICSVEEISSFDGSVASSRERSSSTAAATGPLLSSAMSNPVATTALWLLTRGVCWRAPRRSTLPSAGAPYGCTDAFSALKLKTSFEQ